MQKLREPTNQFNHTSWIAEAIPSDCPKLVRNGCVIEMFDGIFVFFFYFLLINRLLSWD